MMQPRIQLYPALPVHAAERRAFLRQAAMGLAALPILHACTSDALTGVDATASDGGTAADATARADAAQPADGGQTADAGSATSWARGGTAAMLAKASYPNPFTASLSTCALVSTTTEGPCTTSTDLAREDISEGWDGLPVRLALKVVDTSCNVLSGVTVKIWHTNLSGSYSGQTPNPNMCLKQSSYASDDFFRGVQTTDAEGRAFFDTCFPGWYRGRAIHVHFQIKSGNTSTRVSQLFFPEDITSEIFASHADYASFGQPDTTFSNDNIMSGIASSERLRHILEVQRTSDGAMLASKVVTVR